MSNENNYKSKHGIVCFLDRLGTKGIWKTQKPHEVIETWEKLLKESSLDVKLAKNRGIILTIMAFSDTIIITMECDHDKDTFIDECSEMLSAFISRGIHNKIYLRGVVSMGDFYSSEHLMLGKAVDEAASYYEKSNWIGVSSTPSMDSFLTRQKQLHKTTGDFCKYQIPTHHGKKDGWAIRLIPHNACNPSLIKVAHEKIENFEDVSASEKWKNTLDFLYHEEKIFRN